MIDGALPTQSIPPFGNFTPIDRSSPVYVLPGARRRRSPARLFTPRELNLNAAYHAYPPLEGLLTEWWSTWPVYFAFAAAFLYCGHLLVQRLTRRLPAQGQREGQRGSPA